eukprot:scpid108262/ scgid35759/ 
MEAWESGDRSGKTKRIRASKWPQLGDLLYDWMVRARTANITVTDEILSIEAKKLASGLGWSDDDFNASHGFNNRFKVHHQCTSKMKAGDGKDALEDVTIDQ